MRERAKKKKKNDNRYRCGEERKHKTLKRRRASWKQRDRKNKSQQTYRRGRDKQEDIRLGKDRDRLTI